MYAPPAVPTGLPSPRGVASGRREEERVDDRPGEVRGGCEGLVRTAVVVDRHDDRLIGDGNRIDAGLRPDPDAEAIARSAAGCLEERHPEIGPIGRTRRRPAVE